MPRAELELLAPARDADIGIAAIDHGADAVYIGGPAFGARDKAGNDLASLERLTRHAHRYGARIFVTLNTILRDDELDDARRMAWDVWRAGADALIVQDMGLLQLDLPPIQLHASTQCDTRTPAKARFLQDAGFSQVVLARELDLAQIRAAVQAAPDVVIEFFIHGALCVAYSGLCTISHALTGRSANRGSCSQECRQPWTVKDTQGRIVAHDRHVLSLKDNDQSANLHALVQAGVRSFKIEGRYKDAGYVKNVTAHYRRLLDDILDAEPALARASSGRCTYRFEPDPQRSFNRGTTDYFVNGRRDDIGAFDTPKHAGLPLGHVAHAGGTRERPRAAHGRHRPGGAHGSSGGQRPDAARGATIDVVLAPGVTPLVNGDAITWFDRQGELHGVTVNVATPLDAPGHVRATLNRPLAELPDLRAGVPLSRNRDVAWERAMDDPQSAVRRIDVDLTLRTADGRLALTLRDADGHEALVCAAHAGEAAHDAARAAGQIRHGLAKLGDTVFQPREVRVEGPAVFVPAAVVNALRRDGIAALERARADALRPLPRAVPVEPPAPYPDDVLTYLGNVHNRQAHDFYARHGVRTIASAYESHETLGDASLMVTKHCVRFSLSLCPKQAKGVRGVQGSVRADPMTLHFGDDVLHLKFDCRPCEMHVVGRMKKSVLQQARRIEKAALDDGVPMQFYRRGS